MTAAPRGGGVFMRHVQGESPRTAVFSKPAGGREGANQEPRPASPPAPSPPPHRCMCPEHHRKPRQGATPRGSLARAAVITQLSVLIVFSVNLSHRGGIMVSLAQLNHPDELNSCRATRSLENYLLGKDKARNRFISSSFPCSCSFLSYSCSYYSHHYKHRFPKFHPRVQSAKPFGGTSTPSPNVICYAPLNSYLVTHHMNVKRVLRHFFTTLNNDTAWNNCFTQFIY